MPTYTLNDVITNRIDKKVNYGKARTAFDHEKGPNNEAIISPIPNPTHNLWIDSHLIPAVSGTVNTNTVNSYQYNSNVTFGTAVGDSAGVIELTRDPTVADQRSWLACSTVGSSTTRLGDWLRATYGATYLPKFAIATAGGGNGNYDLSQRSDYEVIYAQTTDEEYYWDYESGVFVMFGNPNSTVRAILLAEGSGSHTHSVYLFKGFRYNGAVGLQNFSGGGGGSALTVAEVNDPSSNVSVSSVGEIQFDVDSGFALTDLTGGVVKVAMESTFKKWNVLGQNPLIAQAVDEVTLAEGSGIILTTTAPPSTIQTYYVIVNNNVYEIWDGAGGTGTQLTSFNFISGGTYVFNLEDTTLASNQFELSDIAPDDAIYSNGITYGESGGVRISDGTTGAFLQIKGKNDTAPILYDFSYLTISYTSGATISAQQKTLTISSGVSMGIGTPTDTTFNDGAYYQASTAYQSGNVLSGISTTGSVADALDGLNETIKNIHNNTYVQGAYFTRSPIEGSASPSNPLVVTFTIVDPGDATHMDLEFDNTTQSTSYTPVTNDTTWTSGNSYTYNFTDVLGGSVDVTMTLKCQSASGITGLTEGSYFKYKFIAAVQLWEPDPEVLWTTTNNDQIVDLGSGTAADREIEFDTTNTLYAHYWMIEFGDNTTYPATANPTETNNANISSGPDAWADHDAIQKWTHDYDPGATVTQDTRWTPIVYARSTTARGLVGWTNSLEKADHIEGFITPIAAFTADNSTTGNNDEIGDINVQNATNTAVGHPVKFTNTTQNLGTWGDTTYTWDWGDLTPDTTVTGGDNVDGDYLNDIEHYFTLADDGISETFNVTLKAENNRENQNNDTSTITITVNVDPRASFSGEITNQNTSTPTQSYVDPRIGYNFTKYDPINGGGQSTASNIVDFTNSSTGLTDDGTALNPTYAWTFNNGQTSTISDPPDQTFTTSQSYDVELITQNDNSYAGGTDDTEVKANYVTINPTPARPAGLTGLTIAVPASASYTADTAICADTDDNTLLGSAPTGGTHVNIQIINSMTSDELNNWANEFPSNGTYSGTLKAHVNESSNNIDGMVVFTGANKINRWDSAGNIDAGGLLEITQERDANAGDPTTYPDNFYKQFKAKVHITGLSPGYNTVQLKHFDPIHGLPTVSTQSQWVYDDVTAIPVIASFGTVTEGTGSYRYMSGIKFYHTGSTLTVTGLQINDLTGQTYNDTNSPLIMAQTDFIYPTGYTYTQLGVGAIPSKNLSPTVSALTVPIVDVGGAGHAAVDGKLKALAFNVNGWSATLVDTTNIMYWLSTSIEFDETSFINNMEAGAVSGSDTDCKRIDFIWTGTDYAYPKYFTGAYYTGSDIYTNNQWDKTTADLEYTKEAACYLDKIRWDRTDFSTGYLPVGPDLSTGRSTTDPQFFTFAFKRNSITNFSIKLTGKVSSLWVAMPGAWKNFSGNPVYLDETSGSNGWFDALTNGAGVPFPGVNTSGGIDGNGSDTCRATNFTSNIVAGTAGTDIGTNVTFYQFNTQIGNWTILVRVGLADSSHYVDTISIKDSQDYS